MSRGHDHDKQDEKQHHDLKPGDRLAKDAAAGAEQREAPEPEATLDQRVTAIETWFHANGYTLPPAIPPEEAETKEGETKEPEPEKREPVGAAT
jgi:hypothetical protein